MSDLHITGVDSGVPIISAKGIDLADGDDDRLAAGAGAGVGGLCCALMTSAPLGRREHRLLLGYRFGSSWDTLTVRCRGLRVHDV